MFVRDNFYKEKTVSMQSLKYLTSNIQYKEQSTLKNKTFKTILIFVTEMFMF